MNGVGVARLARGGRRFAPALVGLLLGLALTAGPARAAWQRAPLYGGDVRSLAFDPRDPRIVLAGTSAGQVYRSRDGGESWADAGVALPLPGWVVASLVFDPNRPSRLWAGLWGVWGGGLVVYSDDLGQRWTSAAAPFPDHQIYALVAVPGTPGVLFAATREGVLRSPDDGSTWQSVTAPYPEIVNVSSLAVDPSNSAALIAGTWRRAYKSDDGGLTWRAIFTGMVEDTDVFTLNPVPGRSGEVWASTCGWVYQTTDGGEHWTRHKDGFAERRTPSFRVLADGSLLAGTIAGAYRSSNGGLNWVRTSDPRLSVLAIAQHPARPERVLLGTEGAGVFLSDDGGVHFRAASNGLENVRVMALAKSGPELLVAVNHAGPSSGVYSSFDGGASFALEPSALPTVLDLAALPADNGVWAGTERGLFERRDGAWQPVAQLGTSRVEQVIAVGGRVVVRTAAGFLERDGRPGAKNAKFAPILYKHGAPRSAALAGGALWASDDKGLYRLTLKANHEISAPFAGGRVLGLGDGVLLAGPGGAFRRGSLDLPWQQVASGPWRAVATGSPRYPVLLLGPDSARLLDRDSATLRQLDLPIPARDVDAALIDGDRIYLGTSGYGLLLSSLPPTDPAPPAVGADR